MLHDADHTQGTGTDTDAELRPVEGHDQVGTVEVQILLSWFFETSTPSDLAIDVPRAA